MSVTPSRGVAACSLVLIAAVMFLALSSSAFAAVDLSFNELNIRIWNSSSLVWNDGSLVCTANLNDTDALVFGCTPGVLARNATYRVQVIFKEINNTEGRFESSDGYLEHVGVKGAGTIFGTNPLLGSSCDYNDFGGDDEAGASCVASWNGNNVHVTNPNGGPGKKVRFERDNGVGWQGVMYTITTGTNSTSNATSYIYVISKGNVGAENSSKINITYASLDSTPPAINHLSPASSALMAQTWHNFSWRATDDINDTLLCNLTVDGVLKQGAIRSVNNTPANWTVISLADGAHYWNVSCYDGINWNTSETRTFTIDTTLPAVTLLGPANGVNASQAWYNFSWRATDNINGTLSCNLTINGVVNQSMIGSVNNTVTNRTVNAFQDGMYRWNVSCFDGIGWNTSETRSFLVDITPPVISNWTEQPIGPVEYAPAALYSFTAVVSDALNAIDRVVFTINSTAYTAALIDGRYNVTFIGLGAGVWRYNWTANDTLGNRNTTITSTYVVGTTAGAVNITISPDTTSVYGVPVVINCSSVLGSAPVVLRHNGTLINASQSGATSFTGIFAGGTHNFTCRSNATDSYTSATTEAFLDVARASGALTLSLNGTQGNITFDNGGYINMTAILTAGSGTLAVYRDGALIASGTSPLSIVHPCNFVGYHNITAVYAGNENYTGASVTWWALVIGTDAPSIDIAYPDEGSATSALAINFTWTVSDSLHVNMSCNLSIDGVINASKLQSLNNTATNYSVIGLAQGAHTWNVSCVDGSGTAGYSETHAFTIDRTPPVVQNVTLLPPTNQSEVINVTTDESSNATLNCTPAAGAADTNYGLAHSILLSPLVNNTQYACTLVVCDALGNCATDGTYEFTTEQNTDSVPPVLLSQTATPTNESGVIATLYDEPANVTISYGETLALGSAAANLSYSTTHSVLLPGLVNNTLYYYNITLCDIFGNCDTLGPFNVTTLQNMDDVPPVITNVTITPTNDSAAFSVTTDEAANTSIACAPSGGGIATSYAPTHLVTLNSLVNNTQYACNVTACDAFGNCATDGVYDFTTLDNIDIFPPVITNVTITPTNDSAAFSVTTNEQANTSIVCDPSTGASEASYALTQLLTLSSLGNNTLYSCNVTACDMFGNCVTDGVYDFTTLNNVDDVPPVITNVTIASTNGTAVFGITSDSDTNVTVDCLPTANAVDSDYSTWHNLTLQPLVNNTQYACNVTACDAFDNCVTDGVYEFTTEQNQDLLAPVLIARVDDATNESITIDTTTDEPANITIRYGVEEDDLDGESADDGFDTDKNTVINDLVNGTLYYYNITVCDAFENCKTYGPYQITTLQNEDDVPPVMVDITIEPTNVTAVVNITADERVNVTLVCDPDASATDELYANQHSILLSPLVNNTLYTCNATLCDQFGNCDTTGPYDFATLNHTDDLQAPVIALSAPPNGDNVSSSSATALFIVTDDLALSLACNLSLGTDSGTTVLTDISAANNTLVNVTLGDLVNNTYWWNVSCSDGANTGTSDTWSFLVNITDVVPSVGGSPRRPSSPLIFLEPLVCVPYWQCKDVGDCVADLQRRDCVDINGCGDTSGKPSIIVPCAVVPIVPTEEAPGEPPASSAGTQGNGAQSAVEQPATTPSEPAPPAAIVGGDIDSDDAVSVSLPFYLLASALTLSLLGLGAFAMIALMRNRQKPENFFGRNMKVDTTTYVPYSFLQEAVEVINKMQDGTTVRDMESHSSFVVQVCRHALDKAAKGVQPGKLPDYVDLDSHFDWISAKLYSRIVDIVAAAIVSGMTVSNWKHEYDLIPHLVHRHTGTAHADDAEVASHTAHEEHHDHAGHHGHSGKSAAADHHTQRVS